MPTALPNSGIRPKTGTVVTLQECHAKRLRRRPCESREHARRRAAGRSGGCDRQALCRPAGLLLNRQRCYVANAVKHHAARQTAAAFETECRRDQGVRLVARRRAQHSAAETRRDARRKRAVCAAWPESKADAGARPYPAADNSSACSGHHPPSYLLRIRDKAYRQRHRQDFVSDLHKAVEFRSR